MHKHNTSPSPAGDISNSETLKMVRDMDEHKKDMYNNHNNPGTHQKPWSLS